MDTQLPAAREALSYPSWVTLQRLLTAMMQWRATRDEGFGRASRSDVGESERMRGHVSKSDIVKLVNC